MPAWMKKDAAEGCLSFHPHMASLTPLGAPFKGAPSISSESLGSLGRGSFEPSFQAEAHAVVAELAQEGRLQQLGGEELVEHFLRLPGFGFRL